MEPKIENDITSAGKKIAERTCVLQLVVKRPTFKKRLKSDSFLERSGNNESVDPDVLTVTQELIDRKELTGLKLVKKHLSKYLGGIEIPGGLLTLANGQFLIPVSKIPEVIQHIDDFGTKTSALLDSLEKSYPDIIEAAKVRRGGFFSMDDYPAFHVIRERFNHSYKFISNTVPEELKKVSDALFQQEAVKVKAFCEDAAKKSQEALQAGFRELLAGLVDNLNSPDGKAKKVSERKVKKMRDFLDKFREVNITDDPTLEAFINDTKAVLDHASIDQLSTDQDFKQLVQQSFETVLSNLDTTLTEKRSISLED